MKGKFSISVVLPAKPAAIYRAWLSTTEHSDMTGSPAQIEPRVGGRFSAWDGYISGRTLELDPNRRIVQAWRTSEFSETDPDSKVVLKFEGAAKGTKVTLTHSEIPEGQAGSYRAGWEEWYFTPMSAYFGGS